MSCSRRGRRYRPGRRRKRLHRRRAPAATSALCRKDGRLFARGRTNGSYSVVDLRPGSLDGSDIAGRRRGRAVFRCHLDLATLRVTAVAVAGAARGRCERGWRHIITVGAFDKLCQRRPEGLSVVDLAGALPPGVSFDPTTNTFSFDPSDAAYAKPRGGREANGRRQVRHQQTAPA